MGKQFFYYLLLFCLLLGVFLNFQQEKNLAAIKEVELMNITLEDIIAKSKSVTEYSYRSESTIKSVPDRLYVQKVWVKNDTARMEYTFQTAEGVPLYTHGLIFREGQDDYSEYRIEHPQQEGSVSSGSMSVGRMEGAEERTFLNSVVNLQPENSRIIGQERISGQLCFVVEFAAGKVWVSSKDFVPLRVDYGSAVTDYKEIEIGPGAVTAKDLQMPPNAVPVNQSKSKPVPSASAPYTELYSEPVRLEPGTENKPLTSEQLAAFLKEKDIAPLTVRDIGVWTVVLYQSEDEQGHYILTADKNGSIHESQGKSSNNADFVPVSVGAGGSYSLGVGSICFLTIVINDPEILAKAHSVKVVREGDEEITELLQGQKGLIIPADFNAENYLGQNVLVLAGEGQVIFDNKKFQEDFYSR